jgi:hypothetical protein
MTETVRDRASLTRARAKLSSSVETRPTAKSRNSGTPHAVDGSQRHVGDLHRLDRIGYRMYVAMIVLCGAVLVAATVSAVMA